MHLEFLCLVSSSFLVVSITWTDGQCGKCHCYRNIGQFQRVEHIVNCSKRNLTEIPYDLPSDVHFLDLSENSLGNSDLKNLYFYSERLTTLSLAENNIKHLDADVFSSLTHLEELDLSGNILDYVDEKLFYSLNLRILRGLSAKLFDQTSFRRFGGMEILSVVFYQVSIPEDIFKSLFVFELDVTFQEAKQIPAGLFRFGSNTLTTLSIYGPLLLSIPQDTFKGLTVLKTLTIDGRSMRLLPSNIFYRLSTRRMPIHLHKLRIKGVKALPRDLLVGQKSLKFVTLQNIEDIPPLRLPVQLDSLDLSGSNVHGISASMFADLHNLRELNLSSTSLTSLENDAFVGLKSLHNLDLSRNLITNLPEGIFRACRNTLGSLNLSFNKLQRITEDYFSSVKSLRILNLSSNKINHIEEKSFRNLSSLNVLRIGDNFLSHLPGYLFVGVRSLQMIDLAQNNISKLPSKLFTGYKLDIVNLDDNPLHCDCNIHLMKMDNPFVRFYGMCNSPLEYNGLDIMDLKSNESCRHAHRSSEDDILFSSISTSLNSFIQSSSQQSTPALDPDSTETYGPIVTDKFMLNNISPNRNNFTSVLLETNSLSYASPCSDERVRSVSVYLRHPVREKTDHWDTSFIVLYICVTIVVLVLTVSAFVGCKSVFDKYQRSGTYILPPPKCQFSSVE